MIDWPSRGCFHCLFIADLFVEMIYVSKSENFIHVVSSCYPGHFSERWLSFEYIKGMDSCLGFRIGLNVIYSKWPTFPPPKFPPFSDECWWEWRTWYLIPDGIWCTQEMLLQADEGSKHSGWVNHWMQEVALRASVLRGTPLHPCTAPRGYFQLRNTSEFLNMIQTPSVCTAC